MTNEERRKIKNFFFFLFKFEGKNGRRKLCGTSFLFSKHERKKKGKDGWKKMWAHALAKRIKLVHYFLVICSLKFVFPDSLVLAIWLFPVSFNLVLITYLF